MSTSNLMSLPIDIQWRRLAFSPDMVDTDFDDVALPPKWRSSLTAFFYVVPEETTAETYPDQRVVYLKISCSITGFNLNEELRKVVDVQRVGDRGDDLQKSVWNALRGAWAQEYLPCYGAILQIAVFPHGSEEKVNIWDYPYIIDFQPKKRELFETRTETGEVLSGSSDQVDVKKGTTTTESTEESDILTGVSVSGSGWGVTASTSVSGEWGTRKKSGSEESNVTQTNASQRRRETLSSSTTISQMYQLFNGYHVGTNRAVFFVLPRPHTVAQTSTLSPNLIDGPRKLEGIQEVFLIVVMPKDAVGLCLQANLDTAHPQRAIDGDVLLLTRRRIQSCGRFTDDDGLTVESLDPLMLKWYAKYGFAPAVSAIKQIKEMPKLEFDAPVTDRDRWQFGKVDEFNRFLVGQVRNAMLEAYSSGATPPIALSESEPVRHLVAQLLTDTSSTGAPLIEQLREWGYLDDDDVAQLGRLGVERVGELFAGERRAIPEVVSVRERILDRVISVFQPVAPER